MPKVSVIVPVYESAEYLEKTLESVRNQSFRDLELIAVNDGSADQVQEIIDRYCAEDERFTCIVQDRQGMAAARNAGLRKAAGEYVVFYDAGDEIPERAIAELFEAAKKEFSDMVVGLAEIEDANGVHIPQAIQRLGAQGRIDKYDLDLIQTHELWNKMFRRDVIEKNDLRFESFSRMEDGDFVLRFGQICDSIAGCGSVICRHFRRPDENEENLTQMIPPQAAEDLIRAFDDMDGIIEETYQKSRVLLEQKGAFTNQLEELDHKFRQFREAMLLRFTEEGLLGSIYRYVWKIDEKTRAAIEEKVKEYKSRIYPGDWEREIGDRNEDLALHKKILQSKDDLLEELILSVVISSAVTKEKAGLLVSSLYNQDLPSFEVIVDETLTESIDPVWVQMPNFSEIEHNDNLSRFKENTMKSIRGRYVIFVDEPIMYPDHVIRNMYNRITKPTLGLENHFVTAPFKTLHDGTCSALEANSAAYVNEFVKIRFRSIYNQLDYFWGNKMFYVTYLRGKKVLFTGDAVKDIGKLYNNSNYTKMTGDSVITWMSNADILKHVHNPWVKLHYKSKIKQDAKIQEKIASQDVRIETAAQKFKNWRLQKIRYGYRFLTRKIVYPIYYKWNARKPVDEKKVLFIEPRLDKLTNSIMEIYDYIESSGGYVIHEHYLRDRYARYRHQYKNSMAFLKDFATAKYAIIAEANNTLGCINKRPETIVVNTWHGCGAFKKFGFSTAEKIFGGDMKEKLKYPLYKNLDIVTVSSPDVVWAFEEAMGLQNEGVVRPLGVSRTDVFFDETFVSEAVERVHEAIPQSRDKKIIFYAPTFRGRIATAEGPTMLDIERMAEELSDEYILIIKHHPLVKRPPLIPPDVRDDFAFDMTREGSIDDLICASDICISDYSSLVYEYSLFERPMLFFAYDLDDYFDWRGFYYDYEELTPGPIVTGTEEIIHYIKNIDTLFNKQEVHDFRERFMSSCDGHATERIMAEMMRLGEEHK